jgi:hypothetical protein
MRGKITAAVPFPQWRVPMDDENIAVAAVCLYLACAYAGGPAWVAKANELLDSYAANPDMPPDVVEILERAVDITRLANDPIPLAVVRA